MHKGVASGVKRGRTGRKEEIIFPPSVCRGKKIGPLTILCFGPPQKCSRVLRRNAYIMGTSVAVLLCPPQHNELTLHRTSDVMADQASILLRASLNTI